MKYTKQTQNADRQKINQMENTLITLLFRSHEKITIII